VEGNKFHFLRPYPKDVQFHWFLGSNYLQHAHADGNSTKNFARNFTGFSNWIWFNIGFHTTHHHYPRMHWSKLKTQHACMAASIHPSLIEPHLSIYMVKTFFLGLLFPRYRSQTLMNVDSSSK